MNLIHLKNFRSYENQIINNLSPHINVIIGANGQGKSNLFKAISFVMSDQIVFNRKLFNSYVHLNNSDTLEPLEVQIYLKNKNNRHSDENISKIQRIWKPTNVEQLRINGKLLTQGVFDSYIDGLGLNYSNPYNIIQQGKINLITHMSQTELYELLEEAVGLKKFQIRLDAAHKELTKTEADKNQNIQKIAELKEKLKGLDSKKEQFQFFFLEEQNRKWKNKSKHQSNLKQIQQEKKNLTENSASNFATINNIKIDQKRIQAQLLEVQGNILKNQEKQIYYKFQSLKTGVEIDQQQFMAPSKLKQTQGKLKALEKAKTQRNKEFSKKVAQVEKARSQLQPYKEKYEALVNDVENQKNLEGGDIAKTKLIYQKNIADFKQNIKNVEVELKKYEKLKSEIKNVNDTEQLHELKESNQKLNDLNKDLKQVKIKLIQKHRQKNELEADGQVLKNQKVGELKKIKRYLPMLNLNLMEHVRNSKEQGVYGFLIQYVEIDPTLSYAFEAVGIHKLCTLLVDSIKVGEKLLYLCDKIQAGRFDCFALDYFDNFPAEYKSHPKVQGFFPLVNIIKIKQNSESSNFNANLVKLIQHYFSKYALVKDYELGLDIARRYNLTCITTEKQVIYGQGHLVKIGQDFNAEDRLEYFYKYQEKLKNQKTLQEKIIVVYQDLKDLQNRENQLIFNQKRIQNVRDLIQQKLIEIQTERRKLNHIKTEQENILEIKNKYLQQIKKKEVLIGNLSKKKVVKVNMQQFKEVEQAYLDSKNKLNKLVKEEFLLEEELDKLATDEKQFTLQLQKHKEAMSMKESLHSSEDILKLMGKEQSQLIQKKQELFKQQQHLNQKYREIQLSISNYTSALSFLEEQELFFIQKIKQIGDLDATIEQIQERSNSMSVSLNRSMESMKKDKKPHHYTAKQKLLFSKFAHILDQFRSLEKNLSIIDRNQQNLLHKINTFQEEKSEEMKALFNKFKKQFQRLFIFIVPDGTTDVRLIKSMNRFQKTKGISNFTSCLSIRVSFESGLSNRRFTECSGGQKTVIGICLLMALQKLEPAPFYILDEIDAALDKFYLERVIQLIQEDSHQSQYFITSFKSEMLQFPNEICNYYIVESEDRVSKVKRVNKEDANALMLRLIN